MDHNNMGDPIAQVFWKKNMNEKMIIQEGGRETAHRTTLWWTVTLMIKIYKIIQKFMSIFIILYVFFYIVSINFPSFGLNWQPSIKV